MEENKIKGLVKAISEKTNGILLITPEHKEGIWWNGITPNKLINWDLKNSEIELTIINKEKHKFSNIIILDNKKEKKVYINSEKEEKLRSMALSYAKDLCCSDVINTNEVIVIADGFYNYIKTGNLK